MPGNGDILPKSGSRRKTQAPADTRLALNFLKEALFGLVGAAARPARWVTMPEQQKSTLRLPGQRKRLPCVGEAVMGQKPMTEGVYAIDTVKAIV